jgi:hypothetical protein
MNATEVVWDREETATVASGPCVLAAGLDTAWPPALLLAAAAGVSVLTTFLALAADEGVTPLGYVAQQRPVTDPLTHTITGIAIVASISVASHEEAAGARAAWRAATRAAPVLGIVNCPVTCEAHVVVLRECATA